MTGKPISDTAKAVVRRNTEEVQSGRDFDVFEELFADDFVAPTMAHSSELLPRIAKFISNPLT